MKPSKNYYGILDVASDASQEEIKAAYRKKAKLYHPDHYGQERDRDPFLNVQEAYETLSDPEQRADYDAACAGPRTQRATWSQGHSRVTPASPRPHPSTGRVPYASSDLFATFDAFFDQIWGQRSVPQRPSRRPPSDLHVEVSLTRAQARRGGDVHLRIPVTAPCPVCQRQSSPGMRSVQQGYRCQTCHGAGTVTEEHPVSVSYPAGIQHNTTLFAGLDPVGLDGARLALHFIVT